MSKVKNQPSSRSDARQIPTSPTHSSISSYYNQGELYYWPSILTVLSLGALNILLSGMNALLGSALALINVLIMFEWIKLHSDKLTRKERFFFDETNILETCDKFEFYFKPVIDDEITEGGADQCCGPYPKTASGALSGLFEDKNKNDMQKFYQEHYGQMYTIAKRAETESKVDEKKPKS